MLGTKISVCESISADICFVQELKAQAKHYYHLSEFIGSFHIIHAAELKPPEPRLTGLVEWSGVVSHHFESQLPSSAEAK